MKDKYERKKERKVREEVLDEILPKATGREALLEKKKAIREAHKAREWSPEPMRESDMMGGGDDFKARFNEPSNPFNYPCFGVICFFFL